VVDARDATPRAHVDIDLTRVVFRALDDETIARYVDAERPLDCAGSFKAEGLGIALFERIENTDPTALIGLPLIALARLLRAAGIELP
jgi:septum formation protein